MSKLRDLQSAAVADLATQAKANAAKEAADAAVAKSTPVFAAALKGEPGGIAIDTKIDPPIVYTSVDGITFASSAASSLDDDTPEPPASVS